LGDGTPDEQSSAWIDLLSQYYAASGDTESIRRIEITSKILVLEFRAKWLDFQLGCLSECYDPTIAETIRDSDPQFAKFKLSPDTYEQEIKYIQNIEKRHLAEYDRLKLELAAIEPKNTQVSTRISYDELLLDINQHEHAQYDDNVSTLIFALCVKRLQAHYKSIKEK